jgi:nitroimidazol reductase NimA-like FMN-containing flavoprotein (pyridoxamine 5'-phosphate oxidase superfamily)
MRRSDRAMAEARAREVLERGFCGRLATVSEDGYPYCVPLLYVLIDGVLHVHGTAARSHLRANVEREPRVCFDIDQPEKVFNYGRFECDSGLAYWSVLLFGRMHVVPDTATKQRFCDALMSKYGTPDVDRPKGFYPRLDHITVYALTVERMTGKEQALPDVSEQWPAKDRTQTPNAQAPPTNCP